MNKQLKTLTLLTGFTILMAAVPALADNAPTTAEQMAGMQTMCEETASVRADRQNEKSLYERLGGYDKIYEFVQEIVRRHYTNESIKHMFVGVDRELLTKHVADFVAAGTGGGATYSGRTMPATHAHLGLTDADFLSAGDDIVNSMKVMEYGQNEIEEFVCILVSLKDQVVFK